MKDPRMKILADTLVRHAMRVQPGNNVALLAREPNFDFLELMVQQVQKAGGRPFVDISYPVINRLVALGTDEAMTQLRARFACAQFEHMDCSMHFTGAHNDSEMSDVPAATQAMLSRLYGKPLDVVMRKKKTRWVVVQWPTAEAAQKAQMSTEAFEDFFFDVCCVDYDRMDRDMQPLKQLMEKTDRVHIKGPGTDLSLSIKGQTAIVCAGQFNIPDGEIFTSPLRESVNGVVSFNAPSIEGGFKFDNIRLVFQNGRCVEATANDTKRLNDLLDTDEGARYVGEFALGVNARIQKPMCDTLFDEKIGGSFHMAMGACYDEAPNGNESAQHWDMVCMQGGEGGGEIHFDGILVRKDGQFVPEELRGLNNA
jgi:aminopeptidase